MLRLRVLTALTLMAALVASFAFSQDLFVVVIAVLLGAAFFEWLRLAGHRKLIAILGGSSFVLAIVVAHFFGWRPSSELLAGGSIFACLLWAAIASLLVAAAHGSGRVSTVLSTLLCLVLLAAAWFAAMDLLGRGVLMLFSAVAIVWVADIAAYFVGRAFGKRKLAPLISPGKTWAGVLGAIVAVVAMSFLTRLLWPNANLFSNHLLARSSVLTAVLMLVALVALSIVGDLFESLLKRQAGVKDSSGLLPGHGGVLDRIDAMLPVLPAVIVVTAWMQ